MSELPIPDHRPPNTPAPDPGPLRIALAGDTMLGRGVAQAIASGRAPLLAPDVVALARAADLFVLNLECCISDRGERWRSAGKPFFFRAPPRAAELLAEWGVDVVTLANNHALDYGPDALLDTVAHVEAAGLASVGAGADEGAARAPCRLTVRGRRVAIVAATDHPADFAAGPGRPGVAFADLGRAVPEWLTAAVPACAATADLVLCSVHWGPNMVASPVAHVRRAAAALREAGAGLVVGHSAHIPHGAAGGVLYDIGDFLDDYAVDARLRNDLGFLFLVAVEDGRIEVEAVPLALDFCHTRLAGEAEAAPLLARFAQACADLGGDADVAGGRVRFRLV